uniref:V-type proton ATPase subunit C n=1 Tax=Glossina brevipalpis TaxID=37001 RepID=A0A1A9X4Y6_9MUSC
MSEYWLISAPGDKTCQQTFDTMNNLTSKQNNLCNNYKFHIPDLKVGTLDQLVGLSDDLGKLDTYVEQITRKVAAYLGEVLEDQRDKLQENLLANNKCFFNHKAGPSELLRRLSQRLRVVTYASGTLNISSNFVIISNLLGSRSDANHGLEDSLIAGKL